MEITDKERAVLKGIIDSEYNGDNGRNPIWSWSIRCNLPKRTIPGVVGSLAKKGLVQCDKGETKDEDTVVLTEAGYALVAGYAASKA